MEHEKIKLTLYLPDSSGEFRAVLEQLKSLCDKTLSNRYTIHVVDLSKELSSNRRILSIPLVATTLGGGQMFDWDPSGREKLKAALVEERKKFEII